MKKLLHITMTGVMALGLGACFGGDNEAEIVDLCGDFQNSSPEEQLVYNERASRFGDTGGRADTNGDGNINTSEAISFCNAMAAKYPDKAAQYGWSFGGGGGGGTDGGSTDHEILTQQH